MPYYTQAHTRTRACSKHKYVELAKYYIGQQCLAGVIHNINEVNNSTTNIISFRYFFIQAFTGHSLTLATYAKTLDPSRYVFRITSHLQPASN